MRPRFVYVHGNRTTHWSFAWAPWLKAELEALGYPTFFETMPDSIIARAEYWLPFLRDHIQVGRGDVIVGWSSGAVAAMRYTESIPVLGSILVSPSCTDLDDELEKQSGYFDQPWRWSDIRAHLTKIALVCGDDDPFIPQSEFALIAEQLRPTRLTIPGGKHFIEQHTFPELLSYIVDAYG